MKIMPVASYKYCCNKLTAILRSAKINYNCLTKLDGVKDKFAKTWKVLNFIITQTKLQLICLTRVCSTWKSVMVKTDSFCLLSASHQFVGEYKLQPLLDPSAAAIRHRLAC